MGYDVTNNDSVIELVPGASIPVPSEIVPIVLPESPVPSPELIGTDAIAPVGDTIVLPSTVPSPELIGTDAIAPVGDMIEIPPVVPPDGIILLEVIPIPGVASVVGASRLIELTDVDSIRNDGDVLIYDISTDTYIHVEYAGDAHYIHTQATPLQTWSINHDLGKIPSITVVNSSGTVMLAEINHLDINNAEVIFGNATFTGVAYCN
jgi:hypothetical protein